MGCRACGFPYSYSRAMGRTQEDVGIKTRLHLLNSQSHDRAASRVRRRTARQKFIKTSYWPLWVALTTAALCFVLYRITNRLRRFSTHKEAALPCHTCPLSQHEHPPVQFSSYTLRTTHHSYHHQVMMNPINSIPSCFPFDPIPSPDHRCPRAAPCETCRAERAAHGRLASFT
ncbi:uncharacterized protein J3D65DRAFT_122545 [Phyllosticta citribraziliensis]|uniref:Uncharacterized protein n=1 Tax=Phyllosticta citribraziliensis TaxID=989973 RepID=A0ABR1LAK0_9PEZI